ncbi:MAG: beta-galactosidase [Planctomycetota bacterium]
MMNAKASDVFLSVLVIAAMAAVVLSQDGIGFVNLDFEQGKEPWGVWYSDDPNYAGPKFEYGPDAAVAHSGKASMRIIATSRDARAFVCQSTEKFKPGTRYELSYWLKVSSPEMAETCVVNINLRKPRPDGQGLQMRSIRPNVFTSPGKDGWVLRRAVIDVDPDAKSMQIGLYVQNTVGTAWFDDVCLREWKEGAISVDSMYDYYPLQVKLEGDMVRRFGKLVNDKSPFLDRAKAYNQLMVDVARLTEDARRLQRGAFYLAGLGGKVDVFAEAAAASDIEKELDQLYQLYGRLFAAKNDAGLPEFDKTAHTLADKTKAAREAIGKKTVELQGMAKQWSPAWSVPPAPEPKSIVVTPDGRPNQIVIGTRSSTTHFELEAPLTIRNLHNVSVQYDMGKLTDPTKKYEFSFTLEQWDKLKALGVEQASLATALVLHDNQMTPAWFEAKLKDDPDLLLRAADGAKIKEWRKGSPPLNTWHPEVRAMTLDLIAQMGQVFRPHSQFLWYIVQAENVGPFFTVETGVRSIGYNPSALPDFHAWLRARYKTIAEINRRWKTNYARFEEIQPPEDLCLVTEWKRPHPLGYEFQSWREDRHFAWAKMIYDALKKADPIKPVFSSPSCFLRSLDGSRLFETVDIMGFHARSPHFMLGSIYIHSLNRFARKNLGQYECFWGCQEDRPRIAEERVQRAAMMKYLYRLTVWGRYAQVWWYAYTSADYLLDYNGNWFNPVYDLTTLRYCAAALPVGKEKVKRLEDIFMDSAIVPSRVAMIQPITSMLFQKYARGESFLEMMELHDRLFAQNDLYELIPETYFLDGRASLDNFDVVILPHAPYFPDRLSDQLKRWVEKGGLLVSTGPFGLYDKFGFDDAALWKDVFGPNVATRLTSAQESDWHWDVPVLSDSFGLFQGSLGKGRVIVTLHSLRNAAFAKKVGPLLTEAIEAKAPPAARCASNDFEMTLHRHKAGKLYLCVINRNVDKPVEDDVVLRGEFKRGVDLDTAGGFPIRFTAADGRTAFRLRLEPAEFTMIELEE